ncbi:hypothetical protein COCCADRAFT_100111, partial [Bipolaris zeicola 26-R-13]
KQSTFFHHHQLYSLIKHSTESRYLSRCNIPTIISAKRQSLKVAILPHQWKKPP